MTREIKFRYVLKNNKTNEIKIEIISLDDLENHKNKTEWYGEDWDIISQGQYTGLKDRNGTEIYEGDIVHNSDYYDMIGIVQQGYITPGCHHDCQEVYGWYVQVYSHKNRADTFMMDDNDRTALNSDWEIIGNIFENPELVGD